MVPHVAHRLIPSACRAFSRRLQSGKRGRYVGNLFSTSQLISLLMLPFAIYLLVHFKRRERHDAVPSLRLMESQPVRRTA